MTPGRTSWSRCAWTALLLLPGILNGAPAPEHRTTPSNSAPEHLTWRKDKNLVDADITSWDLVKTLEQISESTGWQIFYEPGAKRTVSTKFKDRPTDRALDLLLGDLGRVLLPGTHGGPSRLLVFKTHEKDATKLVRRTRKVKPIPDELIVRMKASKSVDDLAKKLGAKVIGKSSSMNSGRLKFENEEAAKAAQEALRDNEDVASSDPNFLVESMPVPEASGASTTPSLTIKPVREGEALIVALIDTSVQRQGGPLDGFLLPEISIAGQATLSPDRPSHGYSMFRTFAEGLAEASNGESPVRVLPIDVYGNSPSTSTYEVAEGILRAMQQGAQIINLSLGSEGDTPYLYEVIRAGSESGRIFVGSAGNTPVATPTFPAAYPEVIAVTAGVGPGQLAPYANQGSFVDVMAPGTSIIDFNGRPWRVNGTSPAAAYVSGAIAGTATSRRISLRQSAASVQQALPPPRPAQ